MEYSYYLVTESGVIYDLSPEGFICGGPNKVQPSPKWKAEQLVHATSTRWALDMAHIMASSDGWEIYSRHARFKNGRPQWRLVDLDHGSHRIWGERVSLRKVAKEA